jgi:uncharacterized protein YbjQ (UPF0145 family)
MLITGMSGNEMFCLDHKALSPGEIVVGNSVYSLGFIGGLTSGLRTLGGGEITQVTALISEGRHAALQRLMEEVDHSGADGVTGVVSELKRLGGLIEFTAIGSAVHGRKGKAKFSTACSGQDLFCQMDAGYEPRKFVIGNVAYSVGFAGGFMGFLRTLKGGEVKEFSDIYNRTRHAALDRLEKEAAEAGANCVVDVQTKVMAFGAGVHEMLMVGTACHNPALGEPARPYTSELTGEELWSVTRMGYAPVRLLLGTSIYALGVGGGIASFFQSFSRGEVTGITKLIYEARTNALAHIRDEARSIGADAVVGTRLFVHEVGGGMVEVMAVGTAVKKTEGVAVASPHLIAQSIVRDRDTVFGDFTGGLAKSSDSH